jgi:hypothetical protein
MTVNWTFGHRLTGWHVCQGREGKVLYETLILLIAAYVDSMIERFASREEPLLRNET